MQIRFNILRELDRTFRGMCAEHIDRMQLRLVLVRSGDLQTAAVCRDQRFDKNLDA